MKKTLLITLVFVIQGLVYAQTPNSVGKTVTFSLKAFKDNALRATQSNGLVTKMTSKFPLPDGTLGDFIFDETLISTSKIADIQTLDGISADGKIKIKITITDRMTGIMHTPEGYFFIEPIDAKADIYIIYNMSETSVDNMKCGVLDHSSGDFIKQNKNSIKSISPFPIGTQLRKYRMAAAATGEFVTFYGSQATALARIVDVMNATNLIYELEASIRFELITATTNYTILFTNAGTDPFTPNTDFASSAASQTGFITMNGNSTLPYANYDIGHTFNVYNSAGISSQGEAGPTPCSNTSKAKGWTEWSTGATMPTYLSMVVGIFVHETGHQFRAWHTYNAGSPAFCSGGWDDETAVEPGSGSTLMGYGSNCSSPTNYVLSAPNKLNYFHTRSLHQIFTAVNTNSTCFTSTPTSNTPPVANAGVDITIPKGTPFTLSGSATDANSDAMSYTWDQYDIATANDKGAFGSLISGVGGYTAVNSTTAPLFRSEQSSSTTSRTFPRLTYILNNANNPSDNAGEDLPQVARTMKFRFTVRDNKANGGGVDSDEVIVTVVNAGPFALTSQNTSTLWIYNGTNTAPITWSVNNTTAAPLNVANVKISLSTDGGTTFPIVLAASTPNDGTHTITIPNNLTSQGRIKIEPVGSSVFFDVNNVNITISNSCSPETTNITPTTAVNAIAGNAALNLGLSTYGTAIGNWNGTLTTSSSSSNLSYEGPDGLCSGPSNSNYYNVFSFKVITAATYTFTSTGSSLVMNLYSNTYNSASVCSNWLASSAKKEVVGGSVTINNSFSKVLSPGIYYIVISTFSTSSPSLPVNYSITPSGNSVYSIAPVANSPYAYTYLVKNNTTGNITAFSDDSDLTNSSTYPAGNYTVYGLSYQGGLNLSPYIGTSFTTFQNLLTANTVCGKLSTNSKSVTITGNCNNTLSLSGTGTTGTQQANQTITSTQVINSGSTVTYKAGNSITLSPLTGSGFKANAGSIFKAEIGGCN